MSYPDKLFTIPTNDLAIALGIKPSSMRTRLCKVGHYFGLRPRKLANGRLLWPSNSVELLLKGGK